ncbi:MAG: type II toxin-antitoxin system VapC family toxin [bacterium]|nr:type II toxin-antitoxin system VapC family toxin [bacterium]
MIYLLDANTVIARLNGDLRVATQLKRLKTEDVALCSPVLAELEYGAWYSQRREENLEKLHRLASGMRFEPFGFGASRHFGRLKATLRRQGINKTDFDLAIAAIALDLGAIVVSDDHAFHDGSIEDLQVENWLDEADFQTSSEST